MERAVRSRIGIALRFACDCYGRCHAIRIASRILFPPSSLGASLTCGSLPLPFGGHLSGRRLVVLEVMDEVAATGFVTDPAFSDNEAFRRRPRVVHKR